MSTTNEPFERLVKLAARAFYDDVTTEGENQSGRVRNRGIAVVVLDALTRKQWVREEDLAKELKLHSKQLRQTIRLLEEEKLLTHDHRIERAKGATIYSDAVAATFNSQVGRKVGEEKIKLHTQSYCCLDYAQIYDVVRYRLHHMKKKLVDELTNKTTVREYVCPNCKRRYNTFDADWLVSSEDEYFCCEGCNGELVAETDMLAAQDIGDRDDNARRQQYEKLDKMHERMKEQLKPLREQLDRVKDLPVPEFGSLQAWEAQACALKHAINGDSNPNDPSRSSQGYAGTPMPFLGETQVEVNFSDLDGKEEHVKSESTSESLKVMPPWMIKEEMNLTKEQRGEVKQESQTDGSSAQQDLSDDQKLTTEIDDKNYLQNEYLKAYYAAYFKKPQESSDIPLTSGPSDSSKRQVGMKVKRDDNEVDDGVDREEAPVAGNTTESYKLSDLNVAAEASGDDEDGIDWVVG